MKIESFCIYRWHSINLIPHFSSTATTDNDPPFSITGRWYTLTVLGWVISLLVNNVHTDEIAHVGKVRGWLWSRRRKLWYRIVN